MIVLKHCQIISEWKKTVIAAITELYTWQTLGEKQSENEWRNSKMISRNPSFFYPVSSANLHLQIPTFYSPPAHSRPAFCFSSTVLSPLDPPMQGGLLAKVGLVAHC